MPDDVDDFTQPAHTETTSITKDVLRNTLAYKGMSLEVFTQAVAEVQTLLLSGGSVYPPKEYPSWREPSRGSTIRIYREDDFVGRLSPAEAVGVKILQDESLALGQAFGVSYEQTRALNRALGIGSEGWSSDAIDGIVRFNLMLGMASGVRERILSKQGKPSVKTIGDLARRSWYDIFEDPLKEDSYLLGEHVATKIVDELGKQSREEIPRNPEGARTESEIQARIESRIKGAELAKLLYLETVALASNIVPASLEW